MKPLRAVDVAVLRFLDALVPTVVAGVLVFFSVPYWATEAVNPVAAAVASIGTLTVGTAATVLGQGQFPATRAAEWLWHAQGGLLWDRRRRR